MPLAGRGGNGIAGGGEGSDTTDAVLRIWDVIEFVRFSASASSMRALKNCQLVHAYSIFHELCESITCKVAISCRVASNSASTLIFAVWASSTLALRSVCRVDNLLFVIWA